MLWLYRNSLRVSLATVHVPKELHKIVRNIICGNHCEFRISLEFRDDRFKKNAEAAVAHERHCIFLTYPECAVSHSPRLRHLRQIIYYFLERTLFYATEEKTRKVWVREVTVVCAAFLRTLRECRLLALVPSTSLLRHFFAFFEELGLPAYLVLDGTFHRTE